MGIEVVIALVVAGATALPVVIRVLYQLLVGRRLQRGRTVRLQIDGDTLELTGLSNDEQAALIDAWLNRHVEGSDDAADR